jgi:hypothetical protein
MFQVQRLPHPSGRWIATNDGPPCRSPYEFTSRIPNGFRTVPGLKLRYERVYEEEQQNNRSHISSYVLGHGAAALYDEYNGRAKSS